MYLKYIKSSLQIRWRYIQDLVFHKNRVELDKEYLNTPFQPHNCNIFVSHSRNSLTICMHKPLVMVQVTDRLCSNYNYNIMNHKYGCEYSHQIKSSWTHKCGINCIGAICSSQNKDFLGKKL